MFFKTAALSLTAFLSMTTAAFGASPYAAKTGDSLYKIAQAHQTSVKTIMDLNRMSQSSIYPGQLIYVPGQSKLHRVVYGETLYKISKAYGTSIQKLQSANPQVKNTSLLYPGQWIEVPQPQAKQQAAPSSAPKQMATVASNVSASAKEVASLVNQERSKQGLAPLVLDGKLSNVAQTKAKDMVERNYFSHTSPTYGSPFDMLKQFGISYSAAGENIAEGQSSPQEVMNDWMNSTGHRENILSSKYDKIGVGYYQGAWVQMFIK